MRRVRVSRAKL